MRGAMGERLRCVFGLALEWRAESSWFLVGVAVLRTCVQCDSHIVTSINLLGAAHHAREANCYKVELDQTLVLAPCTSSHHTNVRNKVLPALLRTGGTDKECRANFWDRT